MQTGKNGIDLSKKVNCLDGLRRQEGIALTAKNSMEQRLL
jgi:hypothetical protein